MNPSIITENRKYIRARVRREGCGFTSPCWQWARAVNCNGYAQGSRQGKTVLMSRVSYEAFVGRIGEGLQIDHLCRNRKCVNPEHLEPVTAAENARRRGWKRTTCLYGHPLEGDNIKVFADGRRTCRTCNDAWFRERNRRRTAANRKARAA